MSNEHLFPAPVVPVTIDSRARVKLDDLGYAEQLKIREEFTHANPQHSKVQGQLKSLEKARREGKRINGALFGRLYGQLKSEPPAIETWQEEGGFLTVPRGGTARLTGILETAGFDVEFKDARTLGSGPVGKYELKVPLWDFQRRIVEQCLPKEQGMIRAPTGSGKTIALLALMVQVGVPALVIVWTSALVDQWVRQLREKLGLRESEIGIVGSGERRIRPITVGMQQTLRNCRAEVAPIFGFVGCDEVHKFAANTFREVVDHLPAKYRFGVSADERRKDGKSFLLTDTFGDVEASVDKQSLVDAGLVLDVEVRIVETGFRCPAYERMPDEQKGAYFNELLDAMVQDAGRNRVIEDIAASQSLVGEQVLIFSHRVEHCRRIAADVARRESRVGLLLGGQENREEFRRNVDRILARKLAVGVGTYQAIGTGNDLPSVARGIATTPIHNNAPFIGQVMGRLCRTSTMTGKTSACLYYLWDRAIYGWSPVKQLSRAAKNVNVKVGDEWVPAAEFLERATSGKRT